MVTASLSDPITDWVELLKKQSVFEENGQEWIFRGQSNGSWPLASTLERAVEDFDLDRKLIPDFELKLLHEFMRHYHLYAPESPPRAGDTLDWLALMSNTLSAGLVVFTQDCGAVSGSRQGLGAIVRTPQAGAPSASGPFAARAHRLSGACDLPMLWR